MTEIFGRNAFTVDSEDKCKVVGFGQGPRWIEILSAYHDRIVHELSSPLLHISTGRDYQWVIESPKDLSRIY